MMFAMPPTVVICVAIQLEADAIVRALRLAYHPSSTSASGTFSNVAVQLQLIGVGAPHLPD